jgi:hypothetical protein
LSQPKASPRRSPGRHRDGIAAPGEFVAQLAGRGVLGLERQAGNDVAERLLMHLLVFEDREECFGAGQQRVGRIVERRVRDIVDQRGVAGGSETAHGGALRPVAAPVAPGQIERPRIDAALEKLLEPRVDRRPAQRALVQYEGGERRQVAFVEHERMA